MESPATFETPQEPRRQDFATPGFETPERTPREVNSNSLAIVEDLEMLL
jgi:hypothetical protein